MSEPAAVRPTVVRSRLVLEVASELVGGDGFQAQQAKVLLRPQGETTWPLSLFASDSPAAVQEVADGKVDLGIVNPSAVLTVATLGVSPFRGRLPLRAVAVIPSGDKLVFALSPSAGMSTFENVVARRPALRVSLREQRDHSVHLVLDHVLNAAGCSLADLRAWGGHISYDPLLPAMGDRLIHALNGGIDLVIDEGARTWVADAIAGGMTILSLPSNVLDRLESWGYRRAILSPSAFPGLEEQIHTLDFSGFAIFVREDASSDLVQRVCSALEKRKDRIPDQRGRPIDVEEMCRDTVDAPLGVALHDAAAQYWHERGYI